MVKKINIKSQNLLWIYILRDMNQNIQCNTVWDLGLKFSQFFAWHLTKAYLIWKIHLSINFNPL